MGNKTETIFIIGTGGVGKSTIKELLRKELPEWEVHDFDELGVPKLKNMNEGIIWIKKTTDYWLLRIAETKKRPFIICGLIFPKEIKNSKN